MEGGQPKLITPAYPSYWHGISPDGKFLAYCAKRGEEWDIYAIPTAGGDEIRLTNAPGLDDGPEYSYDGQWIYFNSHRTGRMHLYRMKTDGSEQEQRRRSGTLNLGIPPPSSPRSKGQTDQRASRSQSKRI